MSYKPEMYIQDARTFIQLFGYAEYDRLLSLEDEE